MDWSTVVDLPQSLTTCHQDFLGDWYRDPWGWPELDWVVGERPELVYQRLNGVGSRGMSPIDVPKENYSVRPAVILDPLDRLAYQAIVGSISVNLIASLSRSVYGWRLPVKNPVAGHYSPNNKQWERYQSQLSVLSSRYGAALKTDIVSCFASIPVDLTKEEVERRVSRESSKPIVNRLASYLDGWQKSPRRSGLPQRSQASSILANMVLSRIDDVLQHHAEEFEVDGVKMQSYVRWMDDVWIFGNDPGALRRAQIDIHYAMRDLGLHMNTGKTKLLEGEEIASHVLNAEHSAVDNALISLTGKRDTKPLDQLVERILVLKEEASRTSIKFATERMRRFKHFLKVVPLVETSDRLPHGADALARLFRDAQTAQDLQDWYLDYQKKPIALEWASAQFGTMFPSGTKPSKLLLDCMEEIVASPGASLPLLALAAQRLASWSKTSARVVIGDVIPNVSDPLRRRVLSLAAVNAGCSRKTVAAWLGEFEENDVTRQMLDENSFRPIPFKPDFSA